MYEKGKLVDTQYVIFEGEEILYKTIETYDEAKVMVWDNLTNLKPVCDIEVVK